MNDLIKMKKKEWDIRNSKFYEKQSYFYLSDDIDPDVCLDKNSAYRGLDKLLEKNKETIDAKILKTLEVFDLFVNNK